MTERTKAGVVACIFIAVGFPFLYNTGVLLLLGLILICFGVAFGLYCLSLAFGGDND